MRRFVSAIVALSMLLSISVQVALASDYTSTPVSLWDKYLMMSTKQVSGWTIGSDDWPLCIDFESLVGSVTGRLSASLCDSSDDHLHHADHLTGDSGEDSHGLYALAVCKYCGDHFKVYGADLHDAYDNYLTDNNLDNGASYAPTGVSGHWRSDCPYLVYPSYQGYLGGWGSDSLRQFYKSDSSLVFFTFVLSRNFTYDHRPLVIADHCDYKISGQNYISAIINNVCFYMSSQYAESTSSTVHDNVTPIISYSGDITNFHDFEVDLVLKWYVFDTVSNPAVNISPIVNINNTDYTVKYYNFTTRTYNVTNENGDDITIKYDDDNYTITNNTTGDTNTYNYYITNNFGGDTPVNPDTPGGSCDHTGIESRLDKVLEFLRQIFDKITGKDNNLPVDVPDSSSDAVDPQRMPDFLFNFSNKLLFINDIYKITLQLVRDISNDKFTAYNYPDGVINLPELKSIHVPAPDQPAEDPSGDGTSPSGGSISGVSVPTAPAVSFMFPEYDFYGFNFGGYAVLDFSWYAPYKSRVDGLLSGFLWAGFLWLLFKRLPGIIHGSAMAADTVNYIDNASNDNV